MHEDERDRVRERERTIQSEWQHRLRNTLAMIRSITRRSAWTAQSVESYQEHLEGRLDALTRTQAMMGRSPLDGVDLTLLIAEELIAQGGREGDNCEIEGPPVLLTAKAADTLGLAFHELTTNATKFGALSAPGGRIAIAWSIANAEEARPELRFEWREHVPGGLNAPAQRRGFGRGWLEETLPFDLDAEVSLDFEPEGLRCRITAPLARLCAKH